MIQSVISAIIQMSILIRLNHSISSRSCVLILSVTFVSTVLVVLVTLFEIIFQATNSSSVDSNTDDNKVSRETEMTTTIVRIDDEVTNPIRRETEMMITTATATAVTATATVVLIDDRTSSKNNY